MIDLDIYEHALDYSTDQIAKIIETYCVERLKSDTINYFRYDCPPKVEENEECGEHPIMWFGPELLPFMDHLLSTNGHWSAVFATSATKSEDVQDLWYEPNCNVYWLGDLARQNDWQCGSMMTKLLWHKLKGRTGDPKDFKVEVFKKGFLEEIYKDLEDIFEGPKE